MQPEKRCFIRMTGRSNAYTSLSHDEVIEHLDQKFHSVSHLPQSELVKVFKKSPKSKSTTSTIQIIRNLLEEGHFLLSDRRNHTGSSSEARELTERAGPLKLETVRRHFLVLWKRKGSGDEPGQKLFCIFNDHDIPHGILIGDGGSVHANSLIIHVYSSSQLLAPASKKNYYFHDSLMCLLRLQVSLSIFCDMKYAYFFLSFFLLLLLFFLI
jgi:hypothetical protein